jgi:hypothetical protein
MRNTPAASPKQPTEQARINPSPHQSATLTAPRPPLSVRKTDGTPPAYPFHSDSQVKEQNQTCHAPPPFTGTAARQIKPASQQQAEEANAPRIALQGALATPGAVRALPRAPTPLCQHDDSYARLAMRQARPRPVGRGRDSILDASWCPCLWGPREPRTARLKGTSTGCGSPPRGHYPRAARRTGNSGHNWHTRCADRSIPSRRALDHAYASRGRAALSRQYPLRPSYS